MSWMKLSLLLSGLVLGRHEQAEVDLGKLGEVVFLGRYMRPGDEKLAPEELGRRIDDGLVEYIRCNSRRSRVLKSSNRKCAKSRKA